MSVPAPLPATIQGGTGVGVSNWRLARAVSLRGERGVVSGTAIDTVLVRRLQDGDPGGQMRRARGNTQSHMDYLAEVLVHVDTIAKELRGARIVQEPSTLRHFSARPEPGGT